MSRCYNEKEIDVDSNVVFILFRGLPVLLVAIMDKLNRWGESSRTASA